MKSELFEALRHSFPHWHYWQSSIGLLYARRTRTSPSKIVRAENVDELEAQIQGAEDMIAARNGVIRKSGGRRPPLSNPVPPRAPHERRDGGHSYWYDRP